MKDPQRFCRWEKGKDPNFWTSPVDAVHRQQHAALADLLFAPLADDLERKIKSHEPFRLRLGNLEADDWVRLGDIFTHNSDTQRARAEAQDAALQMRGWDCA